MVFSDLFFLFVFIPAFALCYLLATIIDRKLLSSPTHRSCLSKNIIIVLFSLIFYGWGEPIYVFLMILCVLFNYLSGLGIDRFNGRARKTALVIGLICNIAILGVFKYADFFAQILCDIGLSIPKPNISLPIGISFYTFQSMSYLIDVYRKESPAQRHFGNLLLYISMFPQLVAGPIVRYDTIAREINNRKVTLNDVTDGTYRFLIGLGKKVIIANQFSELADQFLLNGLNDLSTAGAWIGILAFTFQIYFDFSGYSDMAIGMGRCMGFHFNENFNHPYCCNSITDFWRRWHISLGSFFRDYVYIPLGGNRHHQVINILIVWFLTGMWHGASWNFILWGVYFGIIVMLEKYTLLRVINKIPAPFLHLYSLTIVVFGWGLFYFESLDNLHIFVNSFFGNTTIASDIVEESAFFNNFWLWIVAIIFSMPTRTYASNLLSRSISNENAVAWVRLSSRIVISLSILILSVALLVGATNNAFIYTRF